MKALIFAAGLGTRLKPVTDSIPKALVPVAGKPLLEHTISRLKNAGVNEIIINVHHFADQIIDFVHSNQDFGIHIAFSDEKNMLLDTGGGIKKASAFFNNDKPFFVHNVDILSNLDLQALYETHLQSKGIATLFVSKRETSRYLLFDNHNRLCAWYNNKTGEIKPEKFTVTDLSPYQHLAFNGIHVISPAIFPLMENWEGKFSIIDFYLSVARQENIFGFSFENSRIIDVGKIDSLAAAEDFLSEN